MLINLEKSKILPELLKKIIDGLELISNHDSKLHYIISQLSKLLSHTPEVDGEELTNLIDRCAEIVNSYGIGLEKSNFNSLNFLPIALYNAKEEIEHLIIESKIFSQKQALIKRTNIFYKLSMGKKWNY